MCESSSPRAGGQPRFSRQLQRSSLLPTGYGIVESHGWTPALRFAPAGVTQRENRAAISMSHKPEPLVLPIYPVSQRDGPFPKVSKINSGQGLAF